MTGPPVSDYTPYVLQARKRAALRRQQAAARFEQAWITAREIAAFLREKYQPGRIVAFGSLIHPEVFHLESDIDLAVDGIDWLPYLRAWNDVEAHFPEFKVDLIDVGIVSKELREIIEREGQEL